MLIDKYKTYIPQIAFEVTSDCNYRCQFCYNIWKKKGYKELKSKNSFKKAKKTITQLFEIANVRNIIFVGGEPMISERFEELIKFCCKKKKIVSIVSNGSIADENLYKRLIDFGVAFFEFPLFSTTPEIHDNLTQIHNSWENSLKSIDYVLKNNGRVVPITVITKKNYSEIGGVIELLIDKGINQIFINRFNIGGSGIKSVDILLPSLTELKETLQKIDNLANKHKINILSMVSIPHCLINPNDYSNIQFNYCPTNVLNRPLTLDIDGNLRICNHSPIKIGNIFQNKLEEMLTSDYVNSWNKIKPEFCADCEKFERCLAGCRAASEQIGNGLNTEDPIIKMIDKQMINVHNIR